MTHKFKIGDIVNYHPKDRMSPIDALEGGMASFETKRRSRRLVNDSVFADRKLGTTGVAIPCS